MLATRLQPPTPTFSTRKPDTHGICREENNGQTGRIAPSIKPQGLYIKLEDTWGAGHKANEVIVYCYGGRTADMWWEKIKNSTTRFVNLQIINFSEKGTSDQSKLASRTMKMQVNIQDGEVMVSVDDRILYVSPVKWKNTDY